MKIQEWIKYKRDIFNRLLFKKYLPKLYQFWIALLNILRIFLIMHNKMN